MRAFAPNRIRAAIGSLALTACLAATALPLSATTDPLAKPMQAGSLVGRVLDAESREPLGWVTLMLVEIKRGEIAHADGSFHFHDVPVGVYSIKASIVGYQTQIRSVTVTDGDTGMITVLMIPTALQGRTVVITADKGADRTEYEPSQVLSGEKLQQSLGRTLAETLGSEAGVAQRSMGPAPARPVVRGLGGDRLLILQDGERTGDLSATSADHAVAIDPINADRIEIVQGPAALLYSSNALGGVINLINDQIASNLPDRVSGSLSLQGESITKGYSGGLSVRGPLGPVALQAEGTGRSSSDIGTPIGRLANTDLDAYSGSFGASYIGSSGYLGAAGGTYHSEYGIPGGFVGAHPNGVRIVVNKDHVEGRSEYIAGGETLRRMELRGAFTRYHHKELESNGSLGTEFGVLTTDVTAMVHHDTLGPFVKGAIGAWGEHRDFAAGGFTDIPRTVERSVAAMFYEEVDLGGLRLNLGLRYDHHGAVPESTYTAPIGLVRSRTFNGFSGSVAALYDMGGGVQTSLTLMRTFRTPTVEELYLRGPHLASYSFEVGNPDLNAETGLGAELAIRFAAERGHASLTLFRNRIDGYIYARNTGDTNIRTLLPIYRATGGDALMLGGEFSGEYEFTPGLVVAASLNYVQGTLQEDDSPLPMMPPLNGKFELRYTSNAFTFGGNVRAAADQNRLGEFEEPTDGYAVLDAFAQYRYTTSSLLHTIVVTVENLPNTEYRQHLSRVKSIMPEPGRNIKLFYRLYF